MPKNLRSKVLLLLSDMESLGNEGKAAAIERFVETELGYRDQTHYLDQFDLSRISSLAYARLQDSPMLLDSGEPIQIHSENHRAMSWVDAVASFLHNEGILPHRIGFRKGKELSQFRKPE